MEQQVPFVDSVYQRKRRQTRKERCRGSMGTISLRKRLEDIEARCDSKAGIGCRIYAPASVLRIQGIQQWYILSDPAMELALYEDEECIVCADTGCSGADKSSGLQGGKTNWYISKRPSKVSALKRHLLFDEVPISIKHMKGSFKPKVEHTCRVIKSQFSATKARLRELKKSIIDLAMLLALGDTVRGDQMVRT